MVKHIKTNLSESNVKEYVRELLGKAIVNCNLFVDNYFDKKTDNIYDNSFCCQVIGIRLAIIYAEYRLNRHLSLKYTYDEVVKILSAIELFRETQAVSSTRLLNMKDKYISICEIIREVLKVLEEHLGINKKKVGK